MSAHDHKGDWPAFPHHFTHESIGDCEGMTLRQYAAIKLRVPDSGTDWLDDMIRQSLRVDLAGKVTQGIYGTDLDGSPNRVTITEDAYLQADALLKARGQT